MTDIINRYHEAYRMYNKSLKFLEKYSSSYCDYIKKAIIGYFNNHSIDNGVEFCSFAANIDRINVSTDKVICLDDVCAIAELLDLDVTFYNGCNFHFEIKEE